ncbi:MAG: hypothetical protein SGJ20_05705 [Planctomycetota bacterium]|nr:hypothetical protein [Planctomycetota bacterium]
MKQANSSTPKLSRLREFPNTPGGHVGFLESTRDLVYKATAMKLGQVALRIPDDVVKEAVTTIPWKEAYARASCLADLPEKVRNRVTDVLAWDLTVGTVDQISELLRPAVFDLRDAYQRHLQPERKDNFHIVRTAGDYIHAVKNGKVPVARDPKAPALNASAASMAAPGVEESIALAAIDQMHALLLVLGGDREQTIEVLAARVQLHSDMAYNEVCRMPLAGFASRALELSPGIGANARQPQNGSSDQTVSSEEMPLPEVGRQQQADQPNENVLPSIEGNHVQVAEQPKSPSPHDQSTLISTDLNEAPVAPTGFLGATALSQSLKIHPTRCKAFKRKLGRMREAKKLLDDDWWEPSERKHRAPAYFYNSASRHIQHLAEKYVGPPGLETLPTDE